MKLWHSFHMVNCHYETGITQAEVVDTDFIRSTSDLQTVTKRLIFQF